VSPFGSVSFASTAIVTAMPALVVTESPFAVGATLAGTFETLTPTTADVVTLPATSRATAVRLWMPFETSAVFQEVWNGGAAISLPICVAPSKKRTPATPMLSDADAATMVFPERSPPDGDVRLTIGGVVSLLDVTVTTPTEVCLDPSLIWYVKVSL